MQIDKTMPLDWIRLRPHQMVGEYYILLANTVVISFSMQSMAAGRISYSPHMSKKDNLRRRFVSWTGYAKKVSTSHFCLVSTWGGWGSGTPSSRHGTWPWVHVQDFHNRPCYLYSKIKSLISLTWSVDALFIVMDGVALCLSTTSSGTSPCTSGYEYC